MSKLIRFVALTYLVLTITCLTRAELNQSTNPISTARFTWYDSRRDRDVPVKIYSPATSPAPCPIIIFSHGLGGTRDTYEYLGRHWASHGYFVVHVQHLGSDDAVWRDAGLFRGMAAMRKAVADPRNAINRPKDVSFVIDELERLNREKSPYQQQLDLNRIGVAGHSFGAFTALAIAGQAFAPTANPQSSRADARVKAIVPMSAPAPANKRRLDESYANVRIPCFHMTGTKDTSPIGDTTPEERRMPFDHCKNSDQFLLTFKDGDHMLFSGRDRRPSKQERKYQELICESSTAFWNAYLRNDAAAKAWLTNKFKAELGTNGTFEMKLPSERQ
ncbi:MAG TPA: alpha/beta fold hydrolase [Verrucomicrobiae bacterium]|nr:alpha/beta fold hydrolase [Verrucomicrobiae bacterium]